MGLKLYYGGFGQYKAFAVADDMDGAVRNIGLKLNAPFLPITAEEISEVDGCSIAPNGRNTVAVPDTGIGDLSDGYHTFNELYHHRAVLFSVICNSNPDKAWKSKHHDDGTMYDGMFIVGIETPEGQATYHYDIEPYWDMFRVKELPNAPKWDGHTPTDAINRIFTLGKAEAKPVEAEIAVTLRHCKKCDFTCDNQGDLMRHYATVHPKGG